MLGTLFYYIKGGLIYSPIKFLYYTILLNRSQYWDRNKVKKIQLKKLNRLLNYAKNNVEYYNEKYSDFHFPLKDLNEFHELPKTTKFNLREDLAYIKQPTSNKRLKVSTSGSSGEPTSTLISKNALFLRMIGRHRFMKWWKLKPYHRSVLIWGNLNKRNQKHTFANIAQKLLKNRIDISVFDLNIDTVESIFNRIEKFRPKYIRGYKSAIYQFAELLNEKNLFFKNSQLKIAIVTSEVLYESERHFIESILKCKVVNEYGAAEAGLFAFECPHGSMHIFEEAVYLSTDSEGLIRTTELYNLKFPLINYYLEDRVLLDDKYCSCGRSSRIISEIQGRLTDYIVKPDGTNMSQYFFYYLIKEIEKKGYVNSIFKYKIVQKNRTFKFYIVKGSNYSKNIEHFISQRMKNEIGNSIIIKFYYVTLIQKEPNGKLRFFIRLT